MLFFYFPNSYNFSIGNIHDGVRHIGEDKPKVKYNKEKIHWEKW
jgi:hypothetical protein